MWEGKVTVVSCDMREWNAPEKADILVSELLGSFGDNELSPECLDGVQRFLKGTLSLYFIFLPLLVTSYRLFDRLRRWHKYTVIVYIVHCSCTILETV